MNDDTPNWWAKTETLIPVSGDKMKQRVVVSLMYEQTKYFQLSGPTALRSITEMAEVLNMRGALPSSVPERVLADGGRKHLTEGDPLFPDMAETRKRENTQIQEQLLDHINTCDQCGGPDDGCEEGQRLEELALPLEAHKKRMIAHMKKHQ